MPQDRPPRPVNGDDDGGVDNIGPLPPAVTGAKRKADGQADDEDRNGDDDDDEDSGFEDDGGVEVDRTPVTHEVILKDHTKVNHSTRPPARADRLRSSQHWRLTLQAHEWRRAHTTMIPRCGTSGEWIIG